MVCKQVNPIFPSRYLHIPVTERDASFTSRRSSVPQLYFSSSSNSLPSRRGSEPALPQARGPVNRNLPERRNALNPQRTGATQRPLDHLIEYGMCFFHPPPCDLTTCPSGHHVTLFILLLSVIGQVLTLKQFLPSLEIRVQKRLRHVQQILTNGSPSFDITYSSAWLIELFNFSFESVLRTLSLQNVVVLVTAVVTVVGVLLLLLLKTRMTLKPTSKVKT